MTRVVHLIGSLRAGGAEAMLVKLVTNRADQNLEHVVISMLRLDGHSRELKDAGVQAISLNMDQGRISFSGFRKLIQILRNTKPDVLQCWMYHADLLGLLATRFCKVRKIILGIRCSDIDFSKYSRLTQVVVWLDSKLSYFADKIVVNSLRGMKIHGDMGYPLGKMHFIPNGFDVERFQPRPEVAGFVREELGLATEDLLVGLFARYDKMKDHETFFKAARLIVKDVPTVHFVLAGSQVTSENAALQQYLEQEDLRGRVHLLGNREDIFRLTAALDLAVSSSAFGEGFSNAIGEAMACGIPCVATDTGDAREILDRCGCVVPVRNPRALASACVNILLASRERRDEIGRAGRRRILENYALPTIVCEFEHLYT